MIYTDQFSTRWHDRYFTLVKGGPDTTSDTTAIPGLFRLIATYESRTDSDKWGLALNIVEAACRYGKYWNRSTATGSASRYHVQLESAYNSLWCQGSII